MYTISNYRVVEGLGELSCAYGNQKLVMVVQAPGRLPSDVVSCGYVGFDLGTLTVPGLSLVQIR